MLTFILIMFLVVVLIVIGLPVGFAAGISSMLGATAIFGDLFDPRVASMLARVSMDKMDDFLLLAMPFFLLAGRLMNMGGVTERLFGFVALLLRPVRGGLGHANVLASVLFAGMSGSATADAMGLGSIEMKAMLSHGYDRKFSAGVTAASSLISPIIPPSIALVAYAVQAQVSVAALFFAAIVPGLLMAAVMMAWVAIQVRRYNYAKGKWATPMELLRALKPAVLALCTPLIIMVGIYLGIFTPTEAAAVAALYAAFLAIFVYKEMGWKRLLKEIRGTMVDTAVIMLIIGFTSMLGVVMIRGGVPSAFAGFLASLTSDPVVLLLLMCALWLVVGCFMAQTPAILVLTPILVPIAQSYNIDLLHFGIIMTIVLTLGLLTPPVGMVLYALTRVTGLTFEELVVQSLPYLGLVMLVVLLLIFVPDLIIWVPKSLGLISMG